MSISKIITHLTYTVGAGLLKRQSTSKRPLLILGHGRSGTTWAGRIMGSAPRAIYYFEPCSPIVTGHGDFDTWFSYLRPGEHNSLLEQAYDRAFAGLPFGSGWHRGYGARLAPDYQVIVKDVASLMAAEWIAHRYNPQMLILFRHPCPTILSGVRLDVVPQQERDALLRQPHLVEDHLAPYRTILEKVDTPYTILAAIWAARYRVIMNMLPRFPEWHVTQYEDLCYTPMEAYQDLFTRFGLQWSANIQQLIEQSSTQNVPGQFSSNRISEQQLDKWKQHFSQPEVDQIRSIVEEFDLPFYRNEDDWLLKRGAKWQRGEVADPRATLPLCNPATTILS